VRIATVATVPTASSNRRVQASKHSSVTPERFGRRFVESLVQSLLQDGVISTKGKSDQQIHEELDDYFRKLAKSRNIKFSITTDHTSSLLRQARSFFEAGKMESAAVFYAAWFEHTFNRMIICKCAKLDLSVDQASEIIRQVQLHGKTSWLLQLLGYRKISRRHRNAVLKIAETRNAFLHYKFRPDPGEPLEKEEERARKLLSDVESAVRYIKRYESKALGAGLGKVRRVMSIGLRKTCSGARDP
jgi:hypothetical protein